MNLNSVIKQVESKSDSKPVCNVATNCVEVEITDDMRENSRGKDTIPETEDGHREPQIREFHRAIGELGEFAFREYVSNTAWNFEHKGGKTQPDFTIHAKDEGEVDIDIKTRIGLQHYKFDMIAKGDIVGGLHRMYILQWCNWDDDIVQNADTEDDLFKDGATVDEVLEKLQSIVIVGWADDELVFENGEEQEWLSINGNPNPNKRKKLVYPVEHIKPMLAFPYSPQR